MTYWKFLRTGRVSPFTGHVWPADEWQEEKPDPCRSGLHLCRVADLPYWLCEELWIAEPDGPVVEARRKVVAARARLVAQVPTWDEGSRQEFAQECVIRTMGHAQAVLAAATGRRDDRTVRQATKLAGYVLDAADALDAYPVASVAYIAARAAGQARAFTPGVSYAAERAWQAHWLETRLGLS